MLSCKFKIVMGGYLM